ncbi:propionyl-synthetase, putative [Babesia ovata]|uniref:Propionyl-synthetase, putative n=1 Tax=Babesia ovata TaxID=189622 RepID=A0A2H6KFB2_9APIC|nr:propionyl-synthetase, putative [Babesia ovata]GBE61649.1 propionyl-synthetase, putative [Babesia ovata]
MQSCSLAQRPLRLPCSLLGRVGVLDFGLELIEIGLSVGASSKGAVVERHAVIDKHERVSEVHSFSEVVLRVPEARQQQDGDGLFERRALPDDIVQRLNARCTHSGILQQQPIVNVPHVLFRRFGLRYVVAQELEHLGVEIGELAILDEFAEVL